MQRWVKRRDADARGCLEYVRFISASHGFDRDADALSERRLAQVRDERTDARMTIATKAGRRLNPHIASGYNRDNLTRFVERSLKNLDAEAHKEIIERSIKSLDNLN